ncbi:hypothetical protein ACLBYF_22145 [Methylobacterium brachiatum]
MSMQIGATTPSTIQVLEGIRRRRDDIVMAIPSIPSAFGSRPSYRSDP